MEEVVYIYRPNRKSEFLRVLLKNPFDNELSRIGSGLACLLRDIVHTIDIHGLQSNRLICYKNDVDKYFENLSREKIASETAECLRKRLTKYKGKLFTFLDYDGVPWNNNNAEHAIKPFAKYRRLVSGRITENGLRDYLVLLRVYQTCKYKGVNFLKFMLSGKWHIDDFCNQLK